jgi:hypothetical protein
MFETDVPHFEKFVCDAELDFASHHKDNTESGVQKCLGRRMCRGHYAPRRSIIVYRPIETIALFIELEPCAETWVGCCRNGVIRPEIMAPRLE